MFRGRLRGSVVAQAALVAACLIAPAVAHEGEDHGGSAVPSTVSNTLTEPRADLLEGGRLVISYAVQGDRPGHMTLNLQSSGGQWTGTWAFVATRVDDAPHADSEALGSEGEADHTDYYRIIDDGTLSGIVTAAATTAGDGDAPVVAEAQLAVLEGTLGFAWVTGGIASLDANAFELDLVGGAQ